jgi:hypothetical protein
VKLLFHLHVAPMLKMSHMVAQFAVSTAVVRTRKIHEVIGMVRARSRHERSNEYLQFVFIKPSL